MKFFIRILFFSLVLSSKLFSAYLSFEQITVVQPNGQVLNIYASGDEFYNWMHDVNGYTIIMDENTGFYCYAVMDQNKLIASKYIAGISNPFLAGLSPWLTIPSDEIRNLRNKFYSESPKDMADAPKTGLINNIVIFIRFADEPEFADSSVYYNKLFNQTQAGANSMHNYFREASYNQLTVTTTFYPVPPNYIVCSYQDTAVRAYFKPYNAVTNPLGYTSANKTEREHNLLKRASEFVANMVPDTLNLDGDNDGRIDNVCFIVYGSATAWADLLWPHMWSLYSVTAFIRGKRVYTYNFQLQNSLKSSGVGVLCHEMFHSLGAPDLYHYTSNGISPLSRWDIMDANMNPPQHMCSHMKKKYGTWLQTIPVISTPGTYTMKYLLASSDNAYKIPSIYSSAEYFQVEFRRKLSVFENSIPGDGMLIMRINSNLNGNANGPPDEVYCYRPNGTLTSNGSPLLAHFCQEVGRTEINNSTNPTPFLMDGTQGGLNIYNIGTYQDTIISFTLGEPTHINVNSIVSDYGLSQNYPNPFNPSTEIPYKIAKRDFVSLRIYDLTGREVSTLVNKYQDAGNYLAHFDGRALSSGIYFCKIKTSMFSDIIKMMLVK